MEFPSKLEINEFPLNGSLPAFASKVEIQVNTQIMC